MNRLWNTDLELNISAVEHLKAPNPYQTVRDDLRQRLSVGGTSTLLDSFGILACFLFATLVVQSLFVIYVMAVTNRLRLFSRSSLGMWRFETINTHAFCALGFSALSTISWLLRFSSKGSWSFSTSIYEAKEFIDAARGLLILFGSWCFIWASVCQCVSVIWMPRVMSRAPLKNGQGVQLPWSLRWLSHLTFLLPVILVSTIMTWSIVKSTLVVRALFNILIQIYARLTIAAATYDAENYDPTSLWMILLPAQAIPNYHSSLNQFRRAGLKTYLIFEVSTAILYAPLLCIGLRDLRRQTVAPISIHDTTSDRTAELEEITKRLHITQKTLLYRALSVYLFVLCGVPSLAWELCQDVSKLWSSPESAGLMGTVVDLSYTLALNINLLILTIHCGQLFREHRKKNACPEEFEDVEMFYLKDYNQG